MPSLGALAVPQRIVEGHASDMHETAGQGARPMINQATAAGIRGLALSGEVDAGNIHLLRQALRIDGARASRTLLDLGALAFLDASAISALAAAQRDAASADGWIRLASLRATVQRVVEMVGLDTVIPCYPTLRQALTS